MNRQPLGLALVCALLIAVAVVISSAMPSASADRPKSEVLAERVVRPT